MVGTERMLPSYCLLFGARTDVMGSSTRCTISSCSSCHKASSTAIPKVESLADTFPSIFAGTEKVSVVNVSEFCEAAL